MISLDAIPDPPAGRRMPARIAHGARDRPDRVARDGDDDESIETYNTLFCHPIQEVAAVYVQRLSDAHTVTVTACDDEKKDFAINSMDEWKNVRSRISGDGGLSFENAN